MGSPGAPSADTFESEAQGLLDAIARARKRVDGLLRSPESLAEARSGRGARGRGPPTPDILPRRVPRGRGADPATPSAGRSPPKNPETSLLTGRRPGIQ